MTVLSAERVGKRFGANEALLGVSFSAAAGERLAVIGPNGAGKTTLLAILAGALEPDGGELELPPAGWVPQRAAVYGKLTVRENLQLFGRLEKAPDERVRRMLELTELTGDEETGKLSGGNRQRLNIAVGLLGDPPLVLLDEPSASLDPAQRERLWAFIATLEATVLYTTHDVGEADRHADRVLVLADGELLFIGTPHELSGERRDLETAFLELCAGS
jgi:ABC-2 type transport system ATP-binding protein